MNCLLSMNKSARRCVFCTVSEKHDKVDFPALVWKRTSNSYNNSSFWICSIKVDKCLSTYYKLSWKYVNTAKIISKVTITLSLINSNKDFDFVGWVIKTPCVFYLCSVKLQYVKETHDINSLLTLVKIVLASQHKKQPNKSLPRFVDKIENTDSDLKVHALHYANDYSYLPFKNFCKLAKQAETMRNSARKNFGYDYSFFRKLRNWLDTRVKSFLT